MRCQHVKDQRIGRGEESVVVRAVRGLRFDDEPLKLTEHRTNDACFHGFRHEYLAFARCNVCQAIDPNEVCCPAHILFASRMVD
mmetsp:Transcript_41116/g.126950  ORF Transcript_41116/g.126950 Transcript_41116/m.126950 type:complete len:84 (+) Transcript_41116:411-662(+)